jgi:citrate lyase beta subunit
MGMFVVMSLTLKAVFFTIVDLTNVIQEQETWVRISSANGGHHYEDLQMVVSLLNTLGR